MNDIFIFVFGIVVTIIAVGPLMLAAVLDREDESKE